MVSLPWFSLAWALMFDLESVAVKHTRPLSLSVPMAEAVCESQDIPTVWCVSVWNSLFPFISLSMSEQWKAAVSAFCSLLVFLLFLPSMHSHARETASALCVRVCMCVFILQHRALGMWFSVHFETAPIIMTAHYLACSPIKIYLYSRGHNLIAHLHNNYGSFYRPLWSHSGSSKFTQLLKWPGWQTD